jgi:effector-binding domain-containing protein
MKIFISLLVVTVISIIAMGVWGIVSSHVEQASYTIIKADKQYQIRSYPSMLVAQVTVTGDQKTAIRSGFKRLANYIFGNNKNSDNISMTAPVMQSELASNRNEREWKIRFVMPAQYNMQSIPKPNQDEIELIELKPAKYAVITFSGIASSRVLEEKWKELQSYLNANDLKPLSAPVYSFFNPPWTLPFLRRNEVMVEIE